MNARVFLLILVTAFFMAAWNGDQSAMQAAVVRRVERQRLAIAALEVQEATSDSEIAIRAQQPLKTASVKTQPGQVVQTVSAITLQKAVPLPKAITAGTYQAVNQTGTSIRVDVDNGSDTVPRDFYMVDAENGDRWYLIRVTR